MEILKHFNFDKINPITNYFNDSSYEEQIYSSQKYFNFKIIEHKHNHLEELFLFAIVCFLVYIWIKLFIFWDK